MNENIRLAHGSNYQCELCEYVAKIKYDMLKVHMTTLHGQDKHADETSEQSHVEQDKRAHQLSPQSDFKQSGFNLPNTIFNPTPTFIPQAPTSTQFESDVQMQAE